MAGKYNNKKRSYRKRPYRKPRKGAMRYSSKIAKPFPMGQVFSTKLTLSLTQAVSATPVADYVIRASSLYSNGIDATQAVGFDELMAFYQKFRVSGVKCTAKFINTHATTVTVASIIPANTSTSITSLNSARAIAGSVSRIALPTQTKATYHKLFRKSSYVLGNNTQTMKDEDYAGSASADPAHMWYLHLNSHALDEISATTGYWVVTLVYYATFFDRKHLALS